MYGTGSGGSDVIYADSRYADGCGLDTVSGGDGHDTIYGDSEVGLGSGADQINGGTGNDVIYADSRLGSGTGDDEADGGDRADIVYGDSYSGAGFGKDKLYGGSGADVIFGDSMTGAGSGADYLFGDEDSDQLYGDSYLAQGSGNDVLLGGWGADLLVGDSYLSAGTGLDMLDGGMDSDVVYGDSARADGSGHDWLDGGSGTDTMYGDTQLGESLGHDLLIRGEAGEAAQGQAKPGDAVIPDDIEGAGYSYKVNGYTAQYREDPDTGEIQTYDYELGKWNTVGERYWDAERSAWITSTGLDILAEYAGKTIRYDNYGTDMSILKDGAWQPYNPDDQYVVDFKEDPVTGEMLVYDNDLQTWDPYMREYTPVGEDYTVFNDGHTILITDATGCMLSLENYGDGARAKAADSYRWVELSGDLLYHDRYTNIWYAHGWGSWSYSIDLGATWQEVPILQISVSTDGNGGAGSVDIFDRTSISHDDAGLQFLDERYAQSGRHSMDEFYVDLYDGKGYDGEPLVTCYYYFTESDDQDAARGAMTSIPDSGPGNPPEPDAVITRWDIEIFGQWSDKLLSSWEIPNPSQDFRPYGLQGSAVSEASTSMGEEVSALDSTSIPGPITVVLQANDCPNEPTMILGQGEYNAKQDLFMQIEQSLASNVFYKRYDVDSYSVAKLADDLIAFHHVAAKPLIDDVVIFCHSQMQYFRIGVDDISRGNLKNYPRSRVKKK